MSQRYGCDASPDGNDDSGFPYFRGPIMNSLVELQDVFLQDGVDLEIDAREWARIRELLPAEGQPDVDDMRVLIEMRSTARTVCPQFDAYFFPTFKKYLLADGQLSPMEQFELMKLIFGGG